MMIVLYKEVCPCTWRIDHTEVKHFLRLIGKLCFMQQK